MKCDPVITSVAGNRHRLVDRSGPHGEIVQPRAEDVAAGGPDVDLDIRAGHAE